MKWTHNAFEDAPLQMDVAQKLVHIRMADVDRED